MAEQTEHVEDNPEMKAKRPWWVLWAAASFVAVIVVLVVVFSSRPSPSAPDLDGDAADSAPSAYSQTWTTPYAQTTCRDWQTRMSGKEQFAASADILASAWSKIEGSEDFPPDTLIRNFQRDISASCAPDDAVITDVTYLLYNSGTSFRP